LFGRIGILALRSTQKAQPQIRELMSTLLVALKEHLPVVFHDLRF
jgi:thymidylate synthase ThyX